MTTAVSQNAVLPLYPRQDVTLVAGQGTTVVDSDGRSYLDFLAGIAVVGLGHCHPVPLAAASAQLERLWHTRTVCASKLLAGLLLGKRGKSRHRMAASPA